ncbi:MAG: hypothetical protein U0132_18345 [Gemmatimonadaceae bacterium]
MRIHIPDMELGNRCRRDPPDMLHERALGTSVAFVSGAARGKSLPRADKNSRRESISDAATGQPHLSFWS